MKVRRVGNIQAINGKRLVIALIVIDLLMLGVHIGFGSKSYFFNLDHEYNLPTYYQAGKLILSGLWLGAVSINQSVTRRVRGFIGPLSLFMILLGIDELVQIHENIYRIFQWLDILHPSKIVELSMRLGYRSSLWMLYYAPLIFIFVFWSGYWLRYFQEKMKNNARVLALSTTCLFAVLLTEILSSTGNYSETAYGWLVAVEETAEMVFASTLLYVGLKIFKRRVKE